MAMAGEDDADFGGGGDEQWSFDDSLDGLGDSLDANEGEGQPINGIKSTHSMNAPTAAGTALMQEVPPSAGDDGADDGWNDDDLGLLSFEDDGLGVGNGVGSDGVAAIASDADGNEPPPPPASSMPRTSPHPPATSTTSNTHNSGSIVSQHTSTNQGLVPAQDPSPGKAAAARVLGTGLNLLGAGLSATVAALAEPDEDEDESYDGDDADGGWDDDDGLSFGSDNDKVDVSSTRPRPDMGENNGQNPGPVANSDADEEYQPPPPPPFPTAASLLPTASRWGAAIAGAVAPVGVPHNSNAGSSSAGAAPTSATVEAAAVAMPPNRIVDDSSKTMKVGPGPFLGRLTKLIEDAAAPDHVEGRPSQQLPPQPSPYPPAASLVNTRTAPMKVNLEQGQQYLDQNDTTAAQSHDAMEETANMMHGEDGWGNSYDEFEFDDESKDEQQGDAIGGRMMDVDVTESDPSRASVHEQTYGQPPDVVPERQENQAQQRMGIFEEGGAASTEVASIGMPLSEGVFTPNESTSGAPDTSEANLHRDNATICENSHPESAEEHTTLARDVKKRIPDGECTSVCGVACLAAASGEVCKCVEKILIDSSDDDIRLSKVLKTETLRRILLEKKSEADESAVASLAERNSELSSALERETQRSHQLSLELEKAHQQEAEHTASQQASSAAIEEEKQMWAERLSSLEDEVGFLREQLDMASTSASEVDALSAENASLRYELESKLSEHEELCKESNEMSQYKSQVAELSKRVEEVVGENRSLQKQVDELEASKGADPDSDQTKELNEIISSLRGALDEKSAQMERNIVKINELEEKLQSAEVKATSLATDDTESRRIALEDEMQSQRNELEALRADRDRLEEELQERDAAYNQVESDLRSSQDSTARIQMEFDEVADKLESTTRDHLEKLNDNLLRLKELEAINSLLEQEKNDLEMDVVNMATTQEALDFKNAELGATKAANTKLEAEAEANRDAMASLESETSTLKEQVRSLQEELSSAQSTSDDAPCSNAADSAQAEVDRLNDENTRFSHKCQELEQTIDRMQAEASMNEAEVSALETEMEEVTTQRDQLQSQNDMLQSQRSSMSEEHAASNEALASSRIEIISLSGRNQELSSKISNLEEQLRQHSDALERSKVDVEQFILEKESLLNEKKVLEAKIEASEASLDQMKVTVESQEREQINSQKVDEDIIAEKDRALAKLISDNESLHNELAQIASARDEAVFQATVVEKERDEAMSRVEKTQRIVEERNDQIAKLQVDNDSARSYYDKYRELERQVEILEEEQKDKAAMIISLEEEQILKDANGRAALEAGIAEMKAHIASLEADLTTSNEEREQLGLENEELFVELGLLRDMNEKERIAFQAQLESNSSGNDELQSMKHQNGELRALCSERACAIEQKDNRIGELQTEIENLRQEIERQPNEEEMQHLRSLVTAKDEELKTHEHAMETIRSEVDGCRRELAEKEDAINRIEVTKFSVSESLENISSHDVAESVDLMRNNIMLLANAIQAAEIGRAEAMEMVAIEREENAESLKKMAEHLKRFYSSIASS